MSLLVLMWCGGFDIIYALQDEKFDRDHGLHSIPAAMGAKNALRLSSLMHLCVAAMVVVIGKLYLPEPLYVVGAVVFVSLLVYQHAIVRHDDLSRVGVAFGTTNGVASLVYAFFTVAAIWLRSAF